MAGLDPAIPLTVAPPCENYRDRRVEPGDDSVWVCVTSNYFTLLGSLRFGTVANSTL
jgi:hypothetical protein